MFDAYKRFFRFAGEQKGTWYKGMAFELLRSIFEALQFAALLIVLRAVCGAADCSPCSGRAKYDRNHPVDGFWDHGGQRGRGRPVLVSGPQ